MIEEVEIQTVYLNYAFRYKQWEKLIMSIDLLARDDVPNLNKTIGAFYHDELIGTVSFENDTIKYLAILEEFREGGALFNKLVSAILSEMALSQKFHYFVTTKPIYKASFEYLGFKEIVTTNRISFLEKGSPNLEQFLQKIPKYSGCLSAIVMNANPFTKGHLSLVERASRESDHVYLFVLSKEQGVFSSQERLTYVQKGISHLTNVTLISGEDYVISSKTFPTYFLRKDDDISRLQMSLDIQLFKTKIARYLGISKRYVGQEPLSPMTNQYNRLLKELLGPEIELIEIPRTCTEKGEIISATKVRNALEHGELETVCEMLPTTTYEELKKRGKL